MRRFLAFLVLALTTASALALTPGQSLLLFGGGWVFAGASVDMDFATGQYYGLSPSQLTVSRASQESEVCNGTLYTFAVNTPAITPGCGLWAWEARTNVVPNNTMVGASVGVLPTGWSEQNNAGISRTINGVVTANGLTSLSISLSGTSAGGGLYVLLFTNSTAGTAAYGNTWTGTVGLSVASGSLPGPVYNQINNNTSGGVGINAKSAVIPGLGTNLKFSSLSYTPSDATTGAVQYVMLVSIPASTVTNFTLLITAPQLELNPNLPASVASAAITAGGSGGTNGTNVNLTVTGGTCSTQPVIQGTISGNALTAITGYGTPGSCSVLPPSPATITGNSLSGATVTLTPTDNSAQGFATGPILTSGSAATRAASLIKGPAPSAVRRSIVAQGTPFSFNANASGYPSQYFAVLTDGTTSNYTGIFRNTQDFYKGYFSATNAGVYNQVTTGVQLPQSNLWKLGISSVPGSQIGSVNGNSAGSLTNGASNPVNSVTFGADASGASVFDGVISRITIWNTALSQSQLNAVTH